MIIKATIDWKKLPNEAFTDGKYHRTHTWTFDGGISVQASSSPDIVPVPYSDPTLIDPEEAFLASIASCHMLFFLSIAGKQKLIIESYEDHPEAIMEKNEEGKMAITSVVLKPRVKFSGSRQPDQSLLQTIHHKAHDRCFIANSIKSNITLNIQ